MRVSEIKTEARMTRIKGNELEKEELTILPFSMTFLRLTQMEDEILPNCLFTLLMRLM